MLNCQSAPVRRSFLTFFTILFQYMGTAVAQCAVLQIRRKLVQSQLVSLEFYI